MTEEGRMAVEDIFSLVLEIPRDCLNDDSSPDTVPTWTSMAMIDLIAAMEEAYGISFSTNEIRNLNTFGDVKRALHEKGAL